MTATNEQENNRARIAKIDKEAAQSVRLAAVRANEIVASMDKVEGDLLGFRARIARAKAKREAADKDD